MFNISCRYVEVVVRYERSKGRCVIIGYLKNWW